MCRSARDPFFFLAFDLDLKRRGQSIAEKLPTRVEQQGLAIGQNPFPRRLLGFRLQLRGEVDRHLGDLLLKRRFVKWLVKTS